MLADKFLRDELNKFAKYVIQQSRSNLTKRKKNASKELYNSLGYKVSQSAQTTSLAFDMADYGKFQDKGVSGTEKKYTSAKTVMIMPASLISDSFVLVTESSVIAVLLHVKLPTLRKVGPEAQDLRERRDVLIPIAAAPGVVELPDDLAFRGDF